MANAKVNVLAALSLLVDLGRVEHEVLELHLVRHPQPRVPSRRRPTANMRLSMLLPPLHPQCHSDRAH